MKRIATILSLGLVLGMLGGLGVYLARTAPERAMLCCQKPEQAWLQHEFKLTDAQFARVRPLDVKYQADCMQLCNQINATNALLRQQFTNQSAPTPELRQLLARAAQLRAQCQLHMMEYCYAVSREMSPDEGRRYLQWVCDQALTMPRETPMASSK